MPKILKALAIVAALFGVTSFAAPVGAADLWSALRSGGHIALLRHALAPGTGDPANFKVGDCSTQRNLSQQGREQARRIGERFRENGIDSAAVYSSQWCRCRETADLLMLGTVSDLTALNSFYQQRENREAQTKALLAWLQDRDRSELHVLVTHQVNITALTGIYPRSGELVIVRVDEAGELHPIGTIETE